MRGRLTCSLSGSPASPNCWLRAWSEHIMEISIIVNISIIMIICAVINMASLNLIQDYNDKKNQLYLQDNHHHRHHHGHHHKHICHNFLSCLMFTFNKIENLVEQTWFYLYGLVDWPLISPPAGRQICHSTSAGSSVSPENQVLHLQPILSKRLFKMSKLNSTKSYARVWIKRGDMVKIVTFGLLLFVTKLWTGLTWLDI